MKEISCLILNVVLVHLASHSYSDCGEVYVDSKVLRDKRVFVHRLVSFTGKEIFLKEG